MAVPDANESDTLPILIFPLNCFEDGVSVLASQAIPCIGVPSLRARRRNCEDEIFVCPQELLPQPLLAQDSVKVDFRQLAKFPSFQRI